MALIAISSPHAHRPGATGLVMLQVLLALLPGVMVMTWYFGVGTIINIITACAFAVIFEAASLKLRGRTHIGQTLQDYSALVTAVLLAIAIPPYAPWWLVGVGMFFAIVIAKQLYGGLGFNPFNPAMVAYVVLLISFPIEMTQWVSPSPLLDTLPSITDALQSLLGMGNTVNGALIDAWTGPTPLEIVKHNEGKLLSDLYVNSPLLHQGRWAGLAWEWINLAFLAGGAFLLYRRIFSWHAPVGMLGAIVVMSTLFYDGGSSSSGGSPLFHLLSGGTMLGAFFIITDPVSSATSNLGRLIFGAGIGVLVYLIRVWGNYPDAVAFAVLLMNFAAPFIDYYTVPRTYGHKSRPRTSKNAD